MKRILALRAKGLVLPSIHTSLLQAFRWLGVEVFDVMAPKGERDLVSFLEVAKKGRWDAFFLVDLGASECLISELLEIQELLKTPWIVWFVDDPEGYGFPGVCHPQWTLVFCWDKTVIQEQGSWSGWPIIYLPLATDPCLFRSVRNGHSLTFPGGVFVGSTSHDNRLLDAVAKDSPGLQEQVEKLWRVYSRDFAQYPYALAWKLLGQNFNAPPHDPLKKLWVLACVRQLGIRKRIEVVSSVMGTGSAVFGDSGWKGKVAEGLYRGTVPYGDMLCDVYNGSAFVLEVRQPQSRSGLTQRVFDSSACGRPVVAEWSVELPELFNDGEEILSYRNIDECLEVRDRFIRDRRGAEKMGKRAMARVLSQHTYLKRAERIVEEFRSYIA